MTANIVSTNSRVTVLEGNIVSINNTLVGVINGAFSYGNANVATYLPQYNGNLTAGNVTISGSLFVTGNITTQNYETISQTEYANSIIASGNITAQTANMYAANHVANTATYSPAYYWSNGVSAIASAYGNTQVSAYYVANTVATSNVQILNNGNIRLPTGGTINESAGSGTITLSPNTTVNALAGVAIGGLGYLLSPNGSRNAVLNYNSVSGQFGIYQLSVYGSQQNAIQNGGSNNYGNIGSISSFFGNAFVANVYSPNYFYPNGTSILTGIGGTYSNSNVAAYLPTATSITANLGNVITTGGVFWANGVAYSSGGGTYGNTQVAAYLPTYTGNLSAGNITITSNANAANFNATTQVSTPKVQFTVGGAQIIEDNPLDLAIIGKYQISIKANGTQQYTFGNDGSLTGPGGTFVWANGAIGGNVIATGVYWSNGTVFSSGGGSTYGNSDVANYLPTYAGNVNANFYFGNGYYLSGVGGGSTYGDTNVAAYLGANTKVVIGNTNTYSLQANITEIVVGNATILSTGGAGSLTNSFLLNNLYYDANGTQRYRTTGTGAASLTIGGATGFSFGGTSGAVTGNAVSGLSSWATINGTALSTLNSIGITASGTLTTTSGTLASGSATGLLYNTTATSISLGNAAASIYMGSSTGNVFVGNAIGSGSGNLTVRAFGGYNTLTITAVAGGYNSPPYSQALTGGSGTGFTAYYSTAGNGYVNVVYCTNPGTGYKNGDVLTLPSGGGTTVTLSNYNSNKIASSGLADYTFTIDGTLLVPGNVVHPSNSYILGDFTNSNVAYRTFFQTTTANATTGIYAVPSGTGTGASWQALNVNATNANNASKIMITTNGTTDVQLVSGINGTGTYLPLSFYNNGAAQMVLYPNGNINMSNANPITTTGNVSVGNLIVSGAGYIYGNASVGTLTNAANGVGYMGMPQNSQSGSTYAVAIGDAGKHLYFTSATVTATIPANSATAFPIGTTIAFVASSATTLTIAITTDTMYLAGTGTTGSRTLAAYGMATAVKVAATTWFISGTGLT